jgi:hypothetical protein
MTPDELAKIEERYAVWKRGAMAGIDPEGYERWSEARSQLYYSDVPALIAALKEAQGRQAEAMAVLRELVSEERGHEVGPGGETWDECVFCDKGSSAPFPHADDCLWLRAKRLVGGA